MLVVLKLSNGKSASIELESFDMRVFELKEKAAAVVEIPADQQRVVYRGKVLKDADNLKALGVEEGHAFHIVRGQRPPESTVSVPPKNVEPAQTVQAPQTVAPQASDPHPNPYAALFGGSATGLPPPAAGWSQAGLGAGWAPSPAEAQQMMQNPFVAQMVDQMLRNPQMLQQMMTMNPMLRNMPPEVVQQSLQMMNNPAMMQQMMQMSGQMAPQSTNANPRETFATQLEQLRSMGFPNESANLAALQQAGGNIEFAIERLLG